MSNYIFFLALRAIGLEESQRRPVRQSNGYSKVNVSI